MSNIFEKIIAGEIPADIVHRDDEVVAFRDINPAAPVHILVVPVKPIPTVDDIADEDAALLGKMILTARDIARREAWSRMATGCSSTAGDTAARRFSICIST